MAEFLDTIMQERQICKTSMQKQKMWPYLLDLSQYRAVPESRYLWIKELPSHLEQNRSLDPWIRSNIYVKCQQQGVELINFPAQLELMLIDYRITGLEREAVSNWPRIKSWSIPYIKSAEYA